MSKLYIITADYNGKNFLKKYFVSLFNQTYVEFKIIFIENHPENESISFIKNNYSEKLKKEQIIVIENPENYGFAKANNIAIKKAFEDKECELILCLNNDTELDPLFLENILIASSKHPKAGSIQPKMIWGQNPDLLDSVGLEYSKNGLGFNKGAYESSDKYNEEEEILGCCAGACLYRREALEDVKLEGEYFDEDFFAYYEDFDLALRLRWADWSAWYCPDAVVWHYKGGTNEPTSDFTVYYNWRNYTWTLWKNMPLSFLIKNSYLIIICEILQVALNISRGKSAIIKSKIDAYKNLRSFIRKQKIITKRTNFNDFSKMFILKWRP